MNSVRHKLQTFTTEMPNWLWKSYKVLNPTTGIPLIMCDFLQHNSGLGCCYALVRVKSVPSQLCMPSCAGAYSGGDGLGIGLQFFKDY